MKIANENDIKNLFGKGTSDTYNIYIKSYQKDFEGDILATSAPKIDLTGVTLDNASQWIAEHPELTSNIEVFDLTNYNEYEVDVVGAMSYNTDSNILKISGAYADVYIDIHELYLF